MDSNFRALCQESFLDCRLSYTSLFCIGSVLNSVVIQKQVKYVVNKTAAFLQLFFFCYASFSHRCEAISLRV